MKIEEKSNHQVLQMMSNYLNNAPDYIKAEVIEEISNSCHVTLEFAFSALLAAACGLDTEENEWDAKLFHQYFLPMVHQMELKEYQKNPYYQNIKIPDAKVGTCELKQECYQPYEAFVCNDFVRLPDGRILPQIGFFPCKFQYPAILEQDRIWMTITPNEIETMKAPLERAHGRVLTFGLGLGYFAYMASEKTDVSQVMIVDSSEEVISLFIQYILPQFPQKDKIKILHADAFTFAAAHYPHKTYDYIFTDIWHDVSDGIGLYQKMKEFETLNPDAMYDYWIESSIRCYL